MQLVATTMGVGAVLSGITPTRYGTLRVPFASIGDTANAARRLVTAAKALPVPDVDPSAVSSTQEAHLQSPNFFHVLSVEEAVQAMFSLNREVYLAAQANQGRLGEGWRLESAQQSRVDVTDSHKDGYVSAITARRREDDRKVATFLDLKSGLAALEAGSGGRSLQMVVRFWRDPQALEGADDVVGSIETGRHKFNIDPAKAPLLTGVKMPDDQLTLVASAQMLRLDQFGKRFNSARILGPDILPPQSYPEHVMGWAAVKVLIPDFEAPVAKVAPLTQAKFVVDRFGRQRLILYVMSPFPGDLMPLDDALEAKMLEAGGVEFAA